MTIMELDTPALILDEDKMNANFRIMRELCVAAGVALRPHYKSHKSPYLALLQIKNGAKGISCAKTGEAEDLAEAGIQDILIANQVTRPSKILRIAKLAQRSRITVCADSESNIMDLGQVAESLGVELSVLVEYEIGMKRCGVQTREEALALARLVNKQKHLRFRGIQAYAGQLSHEMDADKRMAGSLLIEESLSALKGYLEANGMAVEEISGMSTGTVPLRQNMKTAYTEAQAGSYLTMDMAYGRMGLPFKNSLFVLASVISCRKDFFVTDAGLKTCSVDQGEPVLAAYPGAGLKMSEEHITNHLPGHPYRVNDAVMYIPGHGCTNVNLFDRIHMIRGNEVIREIPVTSRGKSQ